MALRNTTHRWGAIAQLFHWLIVLLIIAQFTLAMLFDDLPAGARKLTLMSRHKSIGITVLGLAALRLLWRRANPVPALPATLKAWERIAAHVTHVALYVLLFAVPVAGWLMSSARGFPVSWFGLAQLPDLVPRNRDLYEVLKTTHDTLAWTLAGVVGLHVAAALKHRYILRDDVLQRMLPFTAARAGQSKP